MTPDDINFEQFFAQKIKDRGISLKKLSEVTGIAPTHIESLLRGDYASMPSAPYFRGYLIHLGSVLDFDGDEWWMKLKKAGVIKNSGELDTLPRNRFIKQSPPKYLWAIGVAAIVIIYLAFQLPHILGKPTLIVTLPDQNPYTTSSSTFIIEGTVKNADSLYLNDNQEITVAADGSWQETVLLGTGPNPFKISAKKFLGGETDVTEQIIYNSTTGASAPGNSNASSSPSGSAATSTASSSKSGAGSAGTSTGNGATPRL
jgi:cytoskeletal protein RodZ